MTTPTWKGVSDNAKNFVKSLLTYDHLKRPSAADALNHKWLQIEQTFDKTQAKDVLENLKSFKADHFLQ